jgi:CRP-like cAMP-binding protein
VRTAGGRRVLGTAGAGAVFGEVACFAGGKRSASVSASNDCAVLRLSRAAALELIERSPAFAMQTVRTLGERLYAVTRPAGTTANRSSIDDVLAGTASARAA